MLTYGEGAAKAYAMFREVFMSLHAEIAEAFHATVDKDKLFDFVLPEKIPLPSAVVNLTEPRDFPHTSPDIVNEILGVGNFTIKFRYFCQYRANVGHYVIDVYYNLPDNKAFDVLPSGQIRASFDFYLDNARDKGYQAKYRRRLKDFAKKLSTKVYPALEKIIPIFVGFGGSSPSYIERVTLIETTAALRATEYLLRGSQKELPNDIRELALELSKRVETHLKQRSI